METVRAEIIESPPLISYYKLTREGPVVADYATGTSNVFVKSNHIAKLWDPDVIDHILSKYGPNVAVLHYEQLNTLLKPYPTFKMILG